MNKKSFRNTVLLISLIPVLFLTACSKGPSGSTMKGLLSSPEIFSYEKQEEVLEFEDYDISESKYEGQKTDVGLLEEYRTKMTITLKAKKDCELSSPGKGAIPFCRSVEESNAKRQARITEVKQMKQDCFKDMWGIPHCQTLTEKRRAQLLTDAEGSYQVDNSKVWKAGQEKSFKAAITFFKDGTKVPEKWVIGGRSSLEAQ